MDRDNQATVEELPDGSVVLHDPAAVAMTGTVQCHALYKVNRERITHFARRIRERGADPARVAIVVIDVDDESGHGAQLAEDLMPGHDWQLYRERGERPCARGLVMRAELEELVEEIAPEEADGARSVGHPDALVVIVAGGTARVYAEPLS